MLSPTPDAPQSRWSLACYKVNRDQLQQSNKNATYLVNSYDVSQKRQRFNLSSDKISIQFLVIKLMLPEIKLNSGHDFVLPL